MRKKSKVSKDKKNAELVFEHSADSSKSKEDADDDTYISEKIFQNGWGKEADGDQRAWLRGRLRTGNGLGELRGRLRTAWVQGGGWKWVGRRSRW